MPKSRHLPLVDALAEREDDAVEGEFYVVKGQCIVCDLPCETAPHNIEWNDKSTSDRTGFTPDHCRVVRQPKNDRELDNMIEAACGSCINAIRYCGTDEYTVQKFRDEGLSFLCDSLPEANLENPKYAEPEKSKFTRVVEFFSGIEKKVEQSVSPKSDRAGG